jgi:hypothetical protein
VKQANRRRAFLGLAEFYKARNSHAMAALICIKPETAGRVIKNRTNQQGGHHEKALACRRSSASSSVLHAG